MTSKENIRKFRGRILRLRAIPKLCRIRKCGYPQLWTQSSKTATLAFGCWCVISCGDCIEIPSIASTSPPSASAGSAAIMLLVNGDHFRRNSTIEWNGAARSTTCVNDHQLMTTISAQDLAGRVTSDVTVFSPPQSQAVTFTRAGTSTSASASSLNLDCGAGGTFQCPQAYGQTMTEGAIELDRGGDKKTGGINAGVIESPLWSLDSVSLRSGTVAE